MQQMSLKMGFHFAWVDFIIHCLSTVSCWVILNGKKGPNFRASRGLRQEDPLSPFLFLICSEGLSALINRAAEECPEVGA